jgi:L-fuculose-phosphate aldolase
VIVTLGGVPTTEYATPGTLEVPESIRAAIRNHDAVILSHHGSLTVGNTLWEAYLRLEKVEHSAQITLAAQQLGQVRTLSSADVQKLAEKRRELLQGEGRDLCEGCAVCVLGDAQEIPSDVLALQPRVGSETVLARQVAQSVVQSFQKT